MNLLIISLKSAVERKKYINSILKDKTSINWIDAVDGRLLSNAEINNRFDIEKFKRYYLKEPRPGEIGCTLSHQKSYRTLLKSSNKSVIIFEDDIVLNDDIDLILNDVEKFLDVEEPRLLLLSGWFWYSSKHSFSEKYKVCKVVDGYLTHAYALNRAAANLMIHIKPYFLADAWEIFIKKGVKIYGLTPHPIDQDWSGVFKSDVLNSKEKHTSILVSSWIRQKIRGVKQRIFKYLNLFEPPQDLSQRVNDIKEAHK